MKTLLHLRRTTNSGEKRRTLTPGYALCSAPKFFFYSSTTTPKIQPTVPSP